jgi:hypothetical protein
MSVAGRPTHLAFFAREPAMSEAEGVGVLIPYKDPQPVPSQLPIPHRFPAKISRHPELITQWIS